MYTDSIITMSETVQLTASAVFLISQLHCRNSVMHKLACLILHLQHENVNPSRLVLKVQAVCLGRMVPTDHIVNDHVHPYVTNSVLIL